MYPGVTAAPTPTHTFTVNTGTWSKTRIRFLTSTSSWSRLISLSLLKSFHSRNIRKIPSGSAGAVDGPVFLLHSSLHFTFGFHSQGCCFREPPADGAKHYIKKKLVNVSFSSNKKIQSKPSKDKHQPYLLPTFSIFT